VLGAVAVVVTVAFLLSMSTSLFSVTRLDVSGGSPEVQRAVRTALQETRGQSLVGIDLERLDGLVAALPSVAAVSFDRAFPHTLRVHVVPERVVGVVRQGGASYLVSARGRVVAQVERREAPKLPRIWAQRTESLRVGGVVSRALLPAVRTVSPLRKVGFPARVASVRVDRDELHLKLGSGLDVRLGVGEDVGLKLAVAGKVLPLLASGTTYLDVSVPERPVAGSPAAAAAAQAAAAEAAATAAAAAEAARVAALAEAAATSEASDPGATDAAATDTAAPDTTGASPSASTETAG
jgi:cell division septal protein FtsQ